ncbi:hypothetical protein L2E82_22560 [Cichorium intybus]|uniref:Uncharacterized protein n=1 Tax=Cichorium intybus TaxID=13427 RepID=A0ACB9DYR6_CICIN|nr:hypothetical protein L2E82_22560 [Cichorium intybus]
MNLSSLNTFAGIAYQCLNPDRNERPKMAQIVEELEKAYKIQDCKVSLTTSEIIQIGLWGNKSSGGPYNCWDFILEKDHKLKQINIDHGDLIYSLTFITESKGILYTSEKAGGRNGGGTVTEKKFKEDEELTGIKGTIRVLSEGQYAGQTILSSLTFITSDSKRGPFGQETDNSFYVPWEKGNFGGFYGLSGDHIAGIGAYMKVSSDGITSIGKWGSKSPVHSKTLWSFRLEKNHHLKRITIDHGYLIFSLMFTTEFRGDEKVSDKAGGRIDGDIVSEVTFAWDEEIIAVAGTIGHSTGTYAGYKIISSLTFITNKQTYGPYGDVTTRPFNLLWDKGSFAGFYGRGGAFIDAIGVYLKNDV